MKHGMGYLTLSFAFVWMPAKELAPVILSHFDAVLPGRRLDALPRFVALLVGDPFHLVEPRNGAPHVLRIVDRLFALGGKGEVGVRQAVFLRRAYALCAPGNVFSLSALVLNLVSNFDIASRGLFLLLC
jgi:hypothetical protein